MKKFFNLQRFAREIKLTEKDDIYANDFSNRIFYALGGNDSIYNTGEYVTVNGGAGNDTVRSEGNSKIDGGAGNDYITASGYGTVTSNSYYVTISGGAGNDSISSGGYSKIDGGAGNDSISSNSYSKVDGGAGNDSIYGSYNSTMNGGAGNDYISLSSYTRNNLIQYASGDGNDTVFGFNSSDTLQIAESNNYTITKNGSDFIVTIGNQKIFLKDSVKNAYDKIHIKNSAGKSIVYNDWETWIGSSGDDRFTNDSDNVALYAKGGNDYIYSYGSNATINGGAGNDSIYGSYDSKIDGGAGNDSIYSSGYSTINGGAGNDSISGGSYSKIDGGAGNDVISGSNNSTINGGAGNDSIYSSDYSHSESKSKIDGGAGNDYITASGDYGTVTSSNSYYVTLSGGAGNDTIRGLKGHVSISGDKGNDTIIINGNSNLLNYANGDGKDIVLGFDSEDILNITEGNYKAKASGDDVIVTVGKGSITLKGMAGEKLTIKNSKGKTTTKTYGKVSASKSVSKLWFAEENNFVQSDLDSIIENKALADFEKIETSEINNLAANTSLTSGINNG